MDLRWRLAVVTGAGAGLGREVAVRLGRLGAGVLAVDADVVAARETAAMVRSSRVSTWTFQADVRDPEDLRLLLVRVHDLGGADLLVNPVGAWPALTAGFLAGLEQRRGRRDEPGAVVNVVPDGVQLPPVDPDERRARVTGLVGAPAAATVVELLAHGRHGEVLSR